MGRLEEQEKNEQGFVKTQKHTKLSLYLYFYESIYNDKDNYKDGIMWLCVSLHFNKPLFLLFGALSHPYTPLHFEEMIFPLVSIIFTII